LVRRLVLLLTLAGSLSSLALADTIVLATDGTSSVSASGKGRGQSFTTPNNGVSYDNLVFNFFEYPSGTADAWGILYLLSSPYAGSPAGLSTSTPGFIDDATASGGYFDFSPSTTLLTDTEYYFYDNLANTDDIEAGSAYLGGVRYTAQTLGDDFGPLTDSFNFELDGTSTSATPEPGTFLLMVPGLGLLLRNRFKRNQAARNQVALDRLTLLSRP